MTGHTLPSTSRGVWREESESHAGRIPCFFLLTRACKVVLRKTLCGIWGWIKSSRTRSRRANGWYFAHEEYSFCCCWQDPSETHKNARARYVVPWSTGYRVSFSVSRGGMSAGSAGMVWAWFCSSISRGQRWLTGWLVLVWTGSCQLTVVRRHWDMESVCSSKVFFRNSIDTVLIVLLHAPWRETELP